MFIHVFKKKTGLSVFMKILTASLVAKSPFRLSSCRTVFFCLFPQCCHCSQPLFSGDSSQQSSLTFPLSVCLSAEPLLSGGPRGP